MSFKTKKVKKEKDLIKKNKKQDKDLNEFWKEDEFVKPQKTYSKKNSLYIIIIAVIAGFLTSLICLFLFLSGAFSNSSIFSWFDADDLLPTQNVVVEKNEQITINENEHLSKVWQETSQSVVSIFNYKIPTNDQTLNFYTQQEFLGNGLILTNDGWIVTTNDVIKSENNFTVIDQNKNIYKVQKIKTDPGLGLVFLKIDANDLSVVSFSQKEELAIGEKTILISGLEHLNLDFQTSYLANKDFTLNNKKTRDSENFYLFLSLAQKNITNNFLGTPVFNLNKKAIGILTEYNNQNYIIPVNYLKRSFEFVLNEKNISQTYLGIDYINLSTNINPVLGSYGALITNIKSASPLKKLDVNVDDVIIQVRDENVNGKKNLTNLIQEYSTGDRIELTLLDAKTLKEKIVEVVLE